MDDDKCQEGQAWQNWADTIEFTPTKLCKPTDHEDVVRIVQEAVDAGKSIRAVGSGHSWSLGAVPGADPYQPDGEASGYLLDLTEMKPQNSLFNPYLKAFYFNDSAGTPHVAVPPGTTQGWMAYNAANRDLDFLHIHSNKHEASAFGSMGPAPDINLGGFIANGCHGTGWQQPTVSDFVVAIEVVTVDKDGDGKPQVVTKSFSWSQEIADILTQNKVFKSTPTVSQEAMLAQRVGLGALGIITKLVFQVEPMFRVEHLDEFVDVTTIFPQDGNTSNLEGLVTSTDYVEIFWFPFTDQLWIKRYSRTTRDTQKVAKVLTFEAATSLLAALTGNLLGELMEKIPASTPLVMNVFWWGLKLLMGERELQAIPFDQDFDAQNDPIVEVPDAYLYQLLYFRNLVDLSYAVPIPKTDTGYDFAGVVKAWQDAVAQIQTMKEQGSYPVNLNVHIRFVKNSDSLLSPANHGNPDTHTCYIEYLSFSQALPQYAEYTRTVGPEWASLDALPHWAKFLQLVPNAYSDSRQKLEERGVLQPFLDQRSEMDPLGVFENNFLEQLLGGEGEAAKVPAPGASTAPQVIATRRFAVKAANQKSGTLPGSISAPATNARGDYLFHDMENKVAALLDKKMNGVFLSFDFPAKDASHVTYHLLTDSRFYRPDEIFNRVGEVLTHGS